MKKKRFWIAGGVAILVLAVMVILSGGQEVQVVKASRGTLTLIVEETGYVQAVNDREIQAGQAGRVVEVMVESGDSVQAGEILMRLSSPEVSAETASVESQVVQAESELEIAQLDAESIQAELKQAESDLARKKALLQSGALARAELEQAELQVAKLIKSLSQNKAQVSALKQQLTNNKEMLNNLEEKSAELQVLSPTSGKVLDLPVKLGQFVSPGTLLAQVGSASQLEIKTELLSDEIRRVRTGQLVQVSAPVLGGQTLAGRVSKIYPRAYEKTSALGVIQRRVPVVIDLEKADSLQPGYEVRVGIETLHKEVIMCCSNRSGLLMMDITRLCWWPTSAFK